VWVNWPVSASKVTWLQAARLRTQDSIPGRGNRFFSFTQHPAWLWGLSNEYQDFYPGGKANGYEIDNSPPPSAKVTLQYVFIV
jgi:hypothetical protein